MISRPRVSVALALLVLGFSAVSAQAGDIPKTALAPYMAIQTALAADSLAEAQKAAATFITQVGALGAAYEKGIAPSRKIAAAADIKAARAAFGELSDVMLAWAGEGTGGTGVRVAYCPMAKKSWLQTGGEIANPYYGSSMLRCGTFTK